MRSRLISILLLFCIPLYFVLGQEKPDDNTQLRQFYILAHVVSDAAPFYFEYVLDLHPDSEKTHVRHIRVARPNHFCNGIVVKATEATIGLTMQNLPGVQKLCSLDPDHVNAVIASTAYEKCSVFDTVGFDIVATCGSVEKTFTLPLAECVDLEKIQKKDPEVANLYYLFGSIKDLAFGKDFSMSNASAQQTAQFRELGDSFVTLLQSGTFGSSLASLMQYYRKGLKEAPAPPELLNPEEYHFRKYVEPEFPMLAARARIQGVVCVELSVDKNSGKVQSARVISGHPLFEESALSAVRLWEFDPALQNLDRLLTVSLDYQIRCSE